MAKFSVEYTGWPWWRKRRLVASERLSPADFDAVAAALDTKPMRARKIAPVAGCRAKTEQSIATNWKGEATVNVARAGDWIVTSLDRKFKPLKDVFGNVNQYVIRPEKFDELYERSPGEHDLYGPLFEPRGIVDALPLTAGFDIVAPWGERQTGTAGYLLRSGADVYGNEKATFEETYEVLDGA